MTQKIDANAILKYKVCKLMDLLEQFVAEYPSKSKARFGRNFNPFISKISKIAEEANYHERELGLLRSRITDDGIAIDVARIFEDLVSKGIGSAQSEGNLPTAMRIHRTQVLPEVQTSIQYHEDEIRKKFNFNDVIGEHLDLRDGKTPKILAGILDSAVKIIEKLDQISNTTIQNLPETSVIADEITSLIEKSKKYIERIFNGDFKKFSFGIFRNFEYFLNKSLKTPSDDAIINYLHDFHSRHPELQEKQTLENLQSSDTDANKAGHTIIINGIAYTINLEGEITESPSDTTIIAGNTLTTPTKGKIK